MIHCNFCIQKFHRLGHRDELDATSNLKPFACNVVFMIWGLRRFHSLPSGFMRFHYATITRFRSLLTTGTQSKPLQYAHRRSDSRKILAEQSLPFLKQFGSFTKVCCFIVFAVRHSAGQGVRGAGRLLHEASQTTQTVTHSCFGSCMFFGGSSTTFSVRTSFLVCVRRFTFGFCGLFGTPSSVRHMLLHEVPGSC